MTDLNSLVIFAKVVEANSYSEAARLLKMPISTVSRRIAELEDRLGVRLLERSTRHLRLTELGAEVLEHARQSSELSDAIENIVLNVLPDVSGALRLCAPPSISDTLVAPVVRAFQAANPGVRIQVLITEHIIDQLPEGVDLAFKVGTYTDPSLTAHTLLTYRHQLVASPAYLEGRSLPQKPQDLLDHRLLAFSFWKPTYNWHLIHARQRISEVLPFQPFLAMNDYAGLSVALLNGAGIGDLPPIVQPDLMREGRLVEVMPDWHFRSFDLTIAHLRNRYLPRPVRAFKDFAVEMVPKLFPSLPN